MIKIDRSMLGFLLQEISIDEQEKIFRELFIPAKSMTPYFKTAFHRKVY